MATAKLFIVEPRNIDGSLNVKDENNCFQTFNVEGVTENQIFDYYFRIFPALYSDSWTNVRKFFANKGWYIREKNW